MKFSGIDEIIDEIENLGQQGPYIIPSENITN